MDVIEWIKSEMQKGSSEEVVRETLELLGYTPEEINAFVKQAFYDLHAVPKQVSQQNEKESISPPVSSLPAPASKIDVDVKEDSKEPQEPLQLTTSYSHPLAPFNHRKWSISLYDVTAAIALLYALSFVIVWL